MFAANMQVFDLATVNAASTNDRIDLSNRKWMHPFPVMNNEIEWKALSPPPPPKKIQRNLYMEPSNVSGETCQQMRIKSAETLEYIKRYRSAVGREIALEEAARWSCENHLPDHSAFKTAKLIKLVLQLQ
jgi:hypothetical protein